MRLRMSVLSPLLLSSLLLMTYSSNLEADSLPDLNLSSLPINNGNVTTSAPGRNYIYVCTTEPFRFARAGAMRQGNWIHADGTFDLSAKPQVEGAVNWPNHQLSITIQGNQRIIFTNDLPSTPTGIFPVQENTLAYSFDRNPNSIQEQQDTFSIPAYPSPAAGPSCLPPGGPIGVYLNGAEFFNALDAQGRNALAYEILDQCWGHPQQDGVYHHHGLSPCLNLGDKNGTSPLIGYALDGFGIYGPYQDGKLLSNQDLDECHGLTSTVIWEGKPTNIYHYVANFEYPYTLGCFRGTATRLPPPNRPPFGPPGGGFRGGPPPP